MSGMGGMGNMGGGMGGMGGMNMGMSMGGGSMTSPTSGSSQLPNVSGHGMSQQSPSTPNPNTPSGQGGLPPNFGGLTPAQMQQLQQADPRMKAIHMQRIMQAQMSGGGGGMQGMGMQGMQGMGGGMQGMQGMGGMGGMTPAQLQQMQMLQQHQQQQHQQQQQAGHGQMARPSSSASFPHPRMSQGQLQPPSTPQPGQQGQGQGQQPHAPQPQMGVMGPPSSIPPRPPTAASQHGHAMHAPHGYQHGGPFPSPSPRPGTAGSRPGTAQSQGQPQGQTQGTQHDGMAAPMPVPHGSIPSSLSGGVPQRPGTSHSMGAPDGTQHKVPSRPPTATGHARPQTPRQLAQQQQQQQQTQARTSPTQQGYPPIAPAPVPAGAQMPGSPHIGVKRKASETPAPAPSTPGPAPGTPAPQMVRSQSQSGGATGITGMGITGNVGPGPGAAQQAQQQPIQSQGALMGGAGGGMMPPPVIPRGGAGQVQGGDAAGVNLGMNLGMGPRQGGALNVNTTNLIASMGMGMGMDGAQAAVPQTPRQTSLPPAAASPFQQTGSPNVPVPGMIGGAPAKPVVKPGTSPAPSAQPQAQTPTVKQEPAAATVTVTQTKIVPQVPSLPATVQLDQKVTRVSVVPLADSDKHIPPLRADEVAQVQKWREADKAYDARHAKMRERMTEEMKRTVSTPRAWWEKDFTLGDGVAEDLAKRRARGEKWQLTGLKSQKEREMKDKKRVGKREGLRLPRRIPDEDAQRPEQLVPIRLEFDVEHHKMRDTFVWNLNDPIITPEIFAQSVVDDYSLAPSYHAIITKSIQEQLSDYKAHSATFGEDGVMIDDSEDITNGKISKEDATWWEAWRKRVRSEALYKLPNPPDPRNRKRRKVVKDDPVEQPNGVSGDAPMTVDDFDEDENLMHEEMRILVKLDIIVGSYKLEDQFEWDLENIDPTPEQFAEIYCTDLGLGGEFRTSIAHAIREQVQTYQKSLFLVGHPSDGSAVLDDDLRMSLLPSLTSGARSMEQVSAFTPQLNYLSESELEKNEKDREKELARRKRKTTRGRRGVALPDREPPKTYRTPAIGFPEISPAALALAAAAAAPTSRRAAAAAASLTIANMVASENRDDRDPTRLILPQTPIAPIVPTPAPAPALSKEKKAKGLFKPPSYPSSVLRPRANVKAPTPSTAADVSNLPPPLENDLPAPSSSGIDRQGSKVVLTAKRVKELEREAKEKEYADGQHANMIDGVWHCSNCGCPESIAVGRRKGPLGDKSQCGTCGKYWHRHRRPRPVTYNSSLEYHQGLLRAEEQQKSAAKRKRPQSTVVEEVKPQIADDEDMGTPAPRSKSKVVKETSVVPDGGPSEAPDRAISPVSTASSGSEPPLAHRVKMNGTHSKSAPPAPSEPEIKIESASASRVVSPPEASPPRPVPSAPPAQNPPLATPQWLTDSMTAMQAKYPDDNFEAVIRKNATSGIYEFRIKCADCPGKHYTPGPGESLTNFEVHLKNRQHRSKVNARLHPPMEASS
ncbi:hypothetical protein V8D89_009559 [Ganoderma adspersum]